MDARQDTILRSQVLGLIPAGGQANRLGPLPCSKELLPIGFREAGENCRSGPKVVCHYLLEKMRRAGVTKAYFVLREGKWDIPSYFKNGEMLGMDLAYLIMGLPYGVPYTLDQAYPFVRNAVIVFGFPDILFKPDDAFEKLLARQAATECDLVLGLFPADQPHKVDMVDLDSAGQAMRIVPRPSHTILRHTWGAAVWTSVFTEFLHQQLAARKAFAPQPELSLGHVIQAAIHNRLRIETLQVSDEPYVDIGTPEDLARATRRFASI